MNRPAGKYDEDDDDDIPPCRLNGQRQCQWEKHSNFNGIHTHTHTYFNS